MLVCVLSALSSTTEVDKTLVWSTLRGESSGKRCGYLGAPVFGRNRNRARNRIGSQKTLTAYGIMKFIKID